MGAVRRNRAVIAWAVLLAFWGQILGGIACAAGGQWRAEDQALAFFDARVLCSDHGAQATAPDTKEKSHDIERRCCGLCIAAGGLALSPPPDLVSERIGVASVTRPAPPTSVTFADALRRSGLGSRAPPLRA
ncbi:MAG: DUF2946 family protein [Variibacter sp.]|nr:DUF2946 family protein [Variibacter sp.]